MENFPTTVRNPILEKDGFATTFMLEYRRSNYENETGVTAEDTVNEVFAKLAIEF
jgi:hypothetical protein